MWDIPCDFNRLIPPEKSGYEFITSLKLYIPHREIGLQLLVRKEQQLPFFYEIILKLVDCKCNQIINISEFTGVEQEVLNDVVGEMSSLDLVHVKGNLLILTPKGKICLNELKETVIEKEEMNRVYINCITGKIVDLESPYKKPTENNPCLHEIIKISDDFIAENFSNFNEYYQKRQEDYEIKGPNMKNEIYQIIGKQYDKLCYSEKRLLIYRNNRDNDLVYECENDTDNGDYGTLFAKQINSFPGTRRFLEKPFNIHKYLHNTITEDKTKRQIKDLLISAIRNKKDSNDGDAEKYYFTDRYLLEREYTEILMSIKNIKPSEILISSGCMWKILNYNVITTLQSNLDISKVLIICDTNEWNIEKLKDEVMDYKQNKKNKIEWIKKSDIGQTHIILFPYCAITINYIPIPVGNDYLIKEVAEITYETAKIKEQKDSLLSENK